MKKIDFFLTKFSFFSKTIRAFIKLITKKNCSDWDLSESLYLLVENFIEKIIFAILRFMIKGKRNILTFEDLKNSLIFIKESDFFSNHNLFYKKLKQKYNFLFQVLKKKNKIPFREKKVYYSNFSFITQTWFTLQNAKSKTSVKKKDPLKKEIKKTYFKKKSTTFSKKSFSLSLLSKKLRCFYEYFIQVFEKGNQKEQNACLESLVEDNGLFSIIPYLIIYINQIFSIKKQNITKLKFGIKIIYVLVWNNFYKIQPFVHQIFPILINCIVGENFSEEKDGEQILKYFGAKIVGFIFSRFGHSYAGLQSKLIFLFSKHLLNSLENFSDLLGPLLALTSFGLKTTELYVIPFLPIILEKIENEFFLKKIEPLDIKSLKNLLDFIINIITSYLIQKNLQIFSHNSLDFFSNFDIEKIYKIFPLVEHLKKKLKTI